ncbi:MAG: hypothetical protein ABIR36_05815 [Nitrospiraceae bacterium]
MVIDREKDHLASAHQIEQEIFVRHEFAQVVFFAEEFAQFLGKRPRLSGFDGVSQERAPGLLEWAQRGNGVIEEMIEKSTVCRPAVEAEKCLDGCQAGWKFSVKRGCLAAMTQFELR